MSKALDSNLDFDGMSGTGVNRDGNKYAGNQSGLTARENYGRGPTKGNQSDSGIERGIGPSVTGDPHKKTIATAGQGGRINGGAARKAWPNADKINVGS